MADALECHQSIVSKLERALIDIDVSSWLIFCSFVSIHPICVKHGFIEQFSQAYLKTSPFENNFLIPKKYRMNRGRKVRSFFPLLKYFYKKLGEKQVDHFISSLGLDPDFFVNLDHQINYQFIIDLFSFMYQTAIIKKHEIKKIFQQEQPSEFSQAFNSRFSKSKNFSLTQLFKVFESFRTNSRFYDCDYQYEVLNFQSNYFDFAVIPEPHIKPVYFSNHCEIGRLLCEVTEGFFINLFRKHCFVQPTLSLMESLGRGDQRCVYRVGVSEMIF